MHGCLQAAHSLVIPLDPSFRWDDDVLNIQKGGDFRLPLFDFLVAVVIRLERAFRRHADIGRLLGRQLGQLHAELL